MFGRLSGLFSHKVAKSDPAGAASRFTSIGNAPPSHKDTNASAAPLFSGTGTLFFKPHAASSFEPLTAIDVATLSITPNGNQNNRPQFLMTVMDPDEGEEPALEQAVDQAMGLSYHHETGAVMWSCVHDGNLRELCFRFTKRGNDSRTFVEVFNMCVYRSLADPSAKKGEEEDDNTNYIASTFTHQQPMRDAQSPEPAEAESQEELFTFEPHRERSVVGGGANIKNVCFADSMQYTRAIVLREVGGGAKELRAYKYDNDGFVAGGGEGFLVDEMAKMSIRDKDNQSLLSADEKHLLALNTAGSIMDIDLTQGSVVTEYKSQAKYPVIAVANRSKFAEADPNLICCLSNNVAFSIDKRMDPSSAVVAEAGKDTDDYALGSLKKPMTCHATSAKGQLVIGDSVGALRLYTGPPGTQRASGGYHPKTAKTLLQGTPGQAILSVDITADGKFVVAATSDHVMVFPIEYLDGSKALNGCDARMGKNKPQPLRLVPTPDQLRQMGTMPQFTGARFDADKNSPSEKWIIATCNNHILTWSMPAVVAALEDNRNVASDLAKETGAVRQVDMRGNRNTFTFMTESTIGTERRSDKPKRKGLSYFSF